MNDLKKYITDIEVVNDSYDQNGSTINTSVFVILFKDEAGNKCIFNEWIKKDGDGFKLDDEDPAYIANGIYDQISDSIKHGMNEQQFNDACNELFKEWVVSHKHEIML